MLTGDRWRFEPRWNGADLWSSRGVLATVKFASPGRSTGLASLPVPTTSCADTNGKNDPAVFTGHFVRKLLNPADYDFAKTDPVGTKPYYGLKFIVLTK